MNKNIGIAATCMTLTLSLACSVAAAQDLGKLGGMIPGASGMTSGSMGNVAGLLQYCVKNNYLGGSSGAAGIQEKLMGKLGGSSDTSSSDSSSTGNMLGRLTGSKKSDSDASTSKSDPTRNPAYLAGAQGMLQSDSGSSTDLSSLGGGSSGLKDKLTKKVCDTVLKQGKSYIGM